MLPITVQFQRGHVLDTYSWQQILGGMGMKTAAECRAMAEECFKWARESYDEDVRTSYLQLGQIWLDAASKLDGLPATQTAPALNERKVAR